MSAADYFVRLQVLLDAASPGPWKWGGDIADIDHPDARLMVAAVNALPALLAVAVASSDVFHELRHDPADDNIVIAYAPSVSVLRDALDILDLEADQ